MPQDFPVYLKASNTDASDQFGCAVAIDGSTMVIGAPLEDSNAVGVGGDASDDSAMDAGAAYVYELVGSTWVFQAYLKASNAEGGDEFGTSVAISGDTVAVGARLEDSMARGIDGDQSDNGQPLSGAVYVFTRSGTTWSQEAYIKSLSSVASDQFGSSIALQNETLVVGAPREKSDATNVDGNALDNSLFAAGAAYVFVRSAGAWNQQAYLKASNTGSGDTFGAALDIDGDTIVVGARDEDSAARGVGGSGLDNSSSAAGAAYVFFRTGTAWAPQAYLKSTNTNVGQFFGGAVAVSGDRIVIGAHQEMSASTGVNGDQSDTSIFGAGAAYTYTRASGVWSVESYLKASNTNAFDRFATSVAMLGDLLVCCADGEGSNAVGIGGDQTDNSAIGSGAAYLFARFDSGWAQVRYIKASNTEASDFFGSQVAMTGGRLLIAAPSEDSSAVGVDGDALDNSAPLAGSAYVYELSDYIVATEVSRVGAPANPDALRPGRTSGPKVGQTWDPWIDHTGFYPTAIFDFLIITTNGTANTPYPIGTILCNLGVPPDAIIGSGVAQDFTFPIPADLQLLGLSACSQGASTGVQGVQLTNALDVVIGNL